MLYDREPLPYQPEKFAQKYPDDESLQGTLKAALELAAKTPPRETDENQSDARRRIDQSFDELRTQTENALEQFHRGERSMRQEEFIRQKEAEIKARHQPGIDATKNLDLKVGGQFARDDELRLFQQNIATNPELKEEMALLVNKQAERAEAISHVIGQVQDGYLKRHDLDGPVPEPPKREASNSNVLKTAAIGSAEFKAALEKEKAEIEKMRRNEMLLPRDFKLNR